MKKVVTIGGGGGHSAVVQALKDLDIDLTVLCNTVDDGGGSGKLMREYGVHSPGDFRRILVTLAEQNAKGLNYRFSHGLYEGQTLSNIILSGLELSTGSFQQAVDTVRNWLGIRQKIAPFTEGTPVLHAETFAGKEIAGQSNIVKHVWTQSDAVERLWLEPTNIALSSIARQALQQADYIIICMGDLYSSIAPFFCIKEVQEMWAHISAKVIWLPNVAVTPGHVHYATTSHALKFLQTLSPLFVPDIIIAHDGALAPQVQNFLQQKGYGVCEQDMDSTSKTYVIREPLVDVEVPPTQAGDAIQRSPVLYIIPTLKNIFEKILV